MRKPRKTSSSKILNRVLQKIGVQSTFANHLSIKQSKNQQKEIRNIFVSSKPNLLKKLAENITMNNLFTSNKGSGSTDNDLVPTCHPGYMYFFLITYLHIFNEMLEEKLKDNLGSNWRGNHVWYNVIVEKNLLDTVFGTKKKLEKLFYASGILRKDNKFQKAKFSTRGEEILTVIQQKFAHLEFKMKSYFGVVQISAKHIQLTLHQVVKLAKSGEDAAAIAIKDEIVHIDDVFDTIFKKLLTRIQTSYPVDHCDIHRKKNNETDGFDSIQTSINLRQNLKLCITKLVS